MYYCPDCKIELTKNTNPFGIYWSCPICNGKAISLSIIRQAIPEPIIGDFWRKVMSGEYHQRRACPACNSLMFEVPITMDGDVLEYLDICKTCYFIWFDPDEFEALPQVEIPEELIQTFPEEVRLAFAKYEIDRIATKLEMELEAEETHKQIAIEALVATALFLIFK